MVTLVQTEITGAAVTGGGVASLYFEDPSSDADLDLCIEALNTFWGTLCQFLDDDVTFQVSSLQQRFAASTGALQEVFTRPGGSAQTGIVTGSTTPRATQALIRWRTSSVVGSRILQGRTYIPGIPTGAMTDTGLLNDTYIAGLQDAAEQLLSDTNNLLDIWHRPSGGAGGVAHLVTGVSIWNQFAVLRSRRD